MKSYCASTDSIEIKGEHLSKFQNTLFGFTVLKNESCPSSLIIFLDFWANIGPY